MRREKTQQVSKGTGLYGHAKPSTYGDRASPHVSSSSSFRRRHDSPIDTSLSPSSRRCHVSPIHTHEVPDSPVPPPIVDASEYVSPTIVNVVDPMPHPEGEAAMDAESEAFGGGRVDFCYYLCSRTIQPDISGTKR